MLIECMCGLLFMVGLIEESAQLLIVSVVLAIAAQLVEKKG